MIQRQYNPIARAYAAALFGAARRQGIGQRAQEEARALVRILEQSPTLAVFLENPQTPEEVKAALLERVFGGRLSPLMLRLLRTLVERHRSAHLGQILDLFQELGERAEGIFQADVSSAYELSFQDKLKLKTALEKYTGCRLKIAYLIEPGLIGGILFRFQDLMIDGSLRGGLEELRGRLIGASLNA